MRDEDLAEEGVLLRLEANNEDQRAGSRRLHPCEMGPVPVYRRRRSSTCTNGAGKKGGIVRTPPIEHKVRCLAWAG